MHFSLSFITFGLAAVQLAAALPRDYQQPSRRSSVGELNDVLVFDAPAFEDPTNTGNTIVQLQAYVSTPQISIAPFLASVGSFLNETIGLNIGSDLSLPASRLALFATFGLSGKDVSVDVSGCGNEATLQPTADGGMAIQNLSIGACGSSSTLGTVDLSDSRNINFTVFPSSSDGFGVISDIDDTVKVSHTLDKLQLAKATLLDNPVPVTNMPAVYSALAKSLNSPQFIYVSGSPFQLYPFLRDFIATTYADAKGPIMLQNLTTTDLSDLLNFAGACCRCSLSY
ncbi:hypothetical protein GGX14DRAFT_612677 [Mycena pura]|uniref:Phosphatidate phosphatase APP1 catalytic domain-containing protein n=1 Tax=Mycena pura TaxID=153505 RepID=A0AAD6YSY2_9AGAR|nr:hypothetical protein GGX14DRAFT_612677 [Mycena pura]